MGVDQVALNPRIYHELSTYNTLLHFANNYFLAWFITGHIYVKVWPKQEELYTFITIFSLYGYQHDIQAILAQRPLG